MARRKQNRRERRRRKPAQRTGGMKRSPTLQALWGSAFALSSLPQAAQADAPVDRTTAEYSYSSYTEDEMDGGKVVPGLNMETKRYEIEMHNFRLRAPLTERSDLGIELTHETMSGASPWYSVPDIAGPGSEPLQFMTGATIEDERTDLNVQYNRYYDNARIGYTAGFSTERDYQAINVGIDGETHFNEGNTTLSGGLGISLDSIDPTDQLGLPVQRPSNESKNSYTVTGGLSQILNRAAVLQTSLTYKYSDGYLADPYKLVWWQDDPAVVQRVSDERPGSRHQFAWLSRFRGHVRELQGTLQADYRMYYDSWDILSHTIDLAWHQQFGKRIAIIPSFRYYAQGQADFYTPYFDLGEALTSLRSSDYRLSAYGSLMFGIKGQYAFRTRWTGKHDLLLTLAWDRYFSSEDLSFEDDAREAPSLVDYNVVTVGLGFLW